MVLIQPFAELPCRHLRVAVVAFGSQGGTASQGAVMNGAPPGAPVSEPSSA